MVRCIHPPRTVTTKIGSVQRISAQSYLELTSLCEKFTMNHPNSAICIICKLRSLSGEKNDHSLEGASLLCARGARGAHYGKLCIPYHPQCRDMYPLHVAALYQLKQIQFLPQLNDPAIPHNAIPHNDEEWAACMRLSEYMRAPDNVHLTTCYICTFFGWADNFDQLFLDSSGRCYHPLCLNYLNGIDASECDPAKLKSWREMMNWTCQRSKELTKSGSEI
jgi:hypothetical protein